MNQPFPDFPGVQCRFREAKAIIPSTCAVVTRQDVDSQVQEAPELSSAASSIPEFLVQMFLA